MSKGKLSIGAATGGIPELLPNEYIFPKNDYKRLCCIIERLRENDLLIQGKINQRIGKL